MVDLGLGRALPGPTRARVGGVVLQGLPQDVLVQVAEVELQTPSQYARQGPWMHSSMSARASCSGVRASLISGLGSAPMNLVRLKRMPP